MLRDAWLFLALAATVLGIATGQEALLFMAALLLTVIPTARLWNRWALHGLRYERTFAEQRHFVGETAELSLALTNAKALPLLWVRVDDPFPEGMEPRERPLLPSGLPKIALLSHVASLLWHETVRWHYQIPCTERGFFFFGPATVRSGDIFGLFESQGELSGSTRLIVYPQVQPLQRLGLPAKDPFGGKRVPLPVFEDPMRVVGTRDYHPDDPMRRVHWKASARTQALQVRVLEPTQAPQQIVLLNVATFERHWQGINRALLEWIISVAASICQHAFNERQGVGLLANASVPQSDQPVKVAAGRSPHQLRLILEALAAITPHATSPIERLLHSESSKMAWGATLVIVTAVVSEALQAEMVRLRRAGRQLALVSLDNRFEEGAAQRLSAQGIRVHRLTHTLDQRGREAARLPKEEGAPELWMRPDGYDADAPYRRPNANGSGE